jgi:AAA+ superfamily predicted ATPase
MSKKEGKFVLKKITKFVDIANGIVDELPESDLCFQNNEFIVQMKFKSEEVSDKKIIQPGVFTITDSANGINLSDISLRKRDRLLHTIDNTSKILHEARTFFNKLHIYEMLERPKKRAVLLYSSPGMGKSSAIERFCTDAVKEDAGTVVIVWPTSAIDADSVFTFLSTKAEYSEKCTRLILIMEDIGGAEGEYRSRRDDVDSGLLSLLDGVGIVFKLPTFIIATTNFPENLLQSLADRPGRFDLMIELKSPSYEEKISLLEFIAKRPLLPEEKVALQQKGASDLSIAHLEEIVIRSMLHDKPLVDVVTEIVQHSNNFKNSFEEKRSLGLGHR